MRCISIRYEVRRDQFGPIYLMGEIDGYVMVRRKGGGAFIRTVREWNALPLEPPRASGRRRR